MRVARQHRSRILFLSAASAAALLLVAPARASAQAPAAIRACASSNGQLRLVGATDTCRNHETLVVWDVQGPQGPKGDKGDTGPAGPGLETGTITGTLVQCNPASGGGTVPLAYANVGVAGHSFSGVTDTNGAFEISYLPQGTYQLVPPGMFSGTNPVAVTSEQTTALGQVLTTDTQSDTANCGTCGNRCGAGQVCTAGTCVTPTPTCTGDHSFCGGTTCIDLTSDNANCGTCGVACAPGDICANGACVILPTCTPQPEVCNGLDDDCDGVVDNGFDLQTDVNNCGACGRQCFEFNAIPGCFNGQCRIAQCNPGFSDCDMDPANGCEHNTASDPNNCGGCGVVCGANQVCSNSVCVSMPAAGAGLF